MNLFRSKKHAESIVLIDISANSVAGAYAHYPENELPMLLYTRRFPIEVREGEPREQAMVRALQILGATLIREGAPALMRVTGSGFASDIIVSIDAPWQKTSVHIEHIEQKTSFIFTKSLVIKKLEETNVVTPGKILVDESVIGTILNGYETSDPYGKQAHRASIIVLTSLIDEKVAHAILAILQSLYHTKRILPITSSSLRYQAIRKIFPHEHDMLIVDAAVSLTSIALVRKGLLMAITETSSRANDSWMDTVATEFAELAKSYPLPRTILLLAREPDVSFLQQKFSTTNLEKLWLSDNPPRIVPILVSHINGLIRQTNAVLPDLSLFLMILYGQQRIIAGKK